jgi:hypothetical protein
MIQSQILTSISSLIINNKDREVSFLKWEYLLWQDKITGSSRDIIEKKYIWFDIIEGMYIYNRLENSNEPILLNVFRKYSKRNFYKLREFPNLWNWVKVETIFKIQDREIFINSFLLFIDNEKKNHTIKDKSSSQKYILDLVKSSKKELGITKLSLSFTIKKYLSEPVLIYEQILSLQDTYKIEGIQIFQWNIVFTLQQIWEETTLIEFNWEDIFINNQKVYFQNRDTFIKDYLRLLFTYYKENNTNTAFFSYLKEFYIKTKHKYPKVSENKFHYYDNLRKSIEEKSKEINGKHNIINFLRIDTSGISCDYYIPEEVKLSGSSVT